MNGYIKRAKKVTWSDSNHSHGMSSKTKEFLQKLCYKRAATVDMTQYGFINDSKIQPVKLLLKPLREKLVTICGSCAERPTYTSEVAPLNDTNTIIIRIGKSF